MNREQRRQQQKKKSKIPKPREKSKSELFSLEMMLTAVLWQLHAEFGWGHQRLSRFTENIRDFFESQLDTNQLTLIDIKNQLKEECDISLNFEYTDEKELRYM